jgi:hypothetical protein
MGVYESCAKIKQSTLEMTILWEQTRAVWRDANARQFEEEFLAQLSVETKKAQSALQNIGPLLSRIRSELRE